MKGLVPDHRRALLEADADSRVLRSADQLHRRAYEWVMSRRERRRSLQEGTQ